MTRQRPSSIILVHGFASNFEHGWRDGGWVDILGDFGVEAPPIDLPGHGTRGGISEATDFDDVPESLFRSLPGSAPYSAVGFSIGAQQVLRMAIAHPESFDRIVLMGIGDSVFDSSSTDVIIDALEADEEPDEVPLRLFRRLAATTGSDVGSLVAFLKRPRPPITDEMLSRVTCPVLVIFGERDAPPPDRLVAGLPDATLVTLPGVDHFSTPQDFGAIDATMGFFDLG
jgi:pimeloyl-ACP methyl ester carboxylesterase